MARPSIQKTRPYSRPISTARGRERVADGTTQVEATLATARGTDSARDSTIVSAQRPMLPTLSVILPVYNERETLPALLARLLPVLEANTSGAFEVLFI